MSSTPLRVFIGWDSREDVAYQVARHSILKHNPDVEVIPLRQYELREEGLYWRGDDKKGSTEFTLTRFLVPFLSNYEGWSLFMDCDMIALDDISNVVLNANERDNGDSPKDVYCVKHEYTPNTMIKMDGKLQHIYPRKNWSSVMLFNNERCSSLTPAVVNAESPLFLHRMLWANKIGDLDHSWNFLAGYYGDVENANLIHYTDGGPWFQQYRGCPHGNLWQEELKELYGI